MRAKLTHRLVARQGRLLYADPLPEPAVASRCLMIEALWPTHEGANAIVSRDGLQYLAAVAALPPFRSVRLTLTPCERGALASLDLCRQGQPYARRGVLPPAGAAIARDCLDDPKMLGVMLDWLLDNAESVQALPAGDVRQAADEVRRYGRWFDSPPRRRRASP